jgi:hypothetical protein
MGRSHSVCQDYAVVGGGERPYVVVADGCSSSPDTDIGARLLARLAARSLRSGMAELDLERMVRRAGKLSSALGLDPSCLDATLLTAWVRGEQWHLAVAGDGVAAWQDRDGRVHVRVVSFTGGYPEYPSYLASPERRRSFDALADNAGRLQRIILEPEGRVTLLPEEPLAPGGFRECGLVRDTAWIALVSDGATSFVARSEDGRSGPVELATVLAELLAFKSLQGVFVQRRLTRFSQQCGTRGWGHQDDLALGAISFGA